MRRFVWEFVLPSAAALWGGGGFAFAQDVTSAPRGGTITGRVMDSSAQTPLVGAEEYIVSSGPASATRGARVIAAGRYIIVGVPAGDVVVRARLVGYAPKDQRVTVREGSVVAASFALVPRSTQLDQVVITGSAGATQRRAVGSVIETINASDVLAVAPARSVEQLVGARTPGLIVLPATGQVGTGAQLRVRGASSLSLSLNGGTDNARYWRVVQRAADRRSTAPLSSRRLLPITVHDGI